MVNGHKKVGDNSGCLMTLRDVKINQTMCCVASGRSAGYGDAVGCNEWIAAGCENGEIALWSAAGGHIGCLADLDFINLHVNFSQTFISCLLLVSFPLQENFPWWKDTESSTKWTAGMRLSPETVADVYSTMHMVRNSHESHVLRLTPRVMLQLSFIFGLLYVLLIFTGAHWRLVEWELRQAVREEEKWSSRQRIWQEAIKHNKDPNLTPKDGLGRILGGDLDMEGLRSVFTSCMDPEDAKKLSSMYEPEAALEATFGLNSVNDGNKQIWTIERFSKWWDSVDHALHGRTPPWLPKAVKYTKTAIHIFVWLVTVMAVAVVQAILTALDCSSRDATWLREDNVTSVRVESRWEWDRDSGVTCYEGDHVGRYVVTSAIVLLPFIFCALRMSVEDSDIQKMNRHETWPPWKILNTEAFTRLQQPVTASFLSTTVHAGHCLLLMQCAKLSLAAVTTFLTNKYVLSSLMLATLCVVLLLSMLRLPYYDKRQTAILHEGCLSIVVWTCMMCIIVSAVDDPNLKAPTFVWYIGIVVVPFVYVKIAKRGYGDACRPGGLQAADRAASSGAGEMHNTQRAQSSSGARDVGTITPAGAADLEPEPEPESGAVPYKDAALEGTPPSAQP
eukprot:COSAG01_NODE_5214_length_4406_cov_5.918737_2_plen_618_part_00